MVRLRKIVPPRCVDIFVKLEWENPTGSVKDRMAHGEESFRRHIAFAKGSWCRAREAWSPFQSSGTVLILPLTAAHGSRTAVPEALTVGDSSRQFMETGLSSIDRSQGPGGCGFSSIVSRKRPVDPVLEALSTGNASLTRVHEAWTAEHDPLSWATEARTTGNSPLTGVLEA